MQSASSNFTQEASGGSVVWAKPRVFADWDRTGYLGAGSIDDLSDQVGDTFSVEHHLDDGLPSEVSQVSGLGSPTLTTPLAYGRGNRASQYFSPYNTTSPVSGFDRDVAPVKLDWGLVTAGGQEYIRLFTGQMTNIPIRGQGAELQAMSATRMKLRKLIQPPAIQGANMGLNATWPITHTLIQCGLYAAPAPRSGCRLYMSMHGSLRPNIPANPSLFAYIPLYVNERTAAAPSRVRVRPGFTSDAPFMMAADLYLNATRTHYIDSASIDLEPGAGILTNTQNAGRVEFWVRGDTADVANAPGGSGIVAMLAGLTIQNNVTNTGKITCGVSTTRGIFVTAADGTNTQTLTHSTALPTDNAWHSVGAAWDIAAGKLWVYLDGVEQSSTVVLTTANLPNAEKFDINTPGLTAFIPVAEVHLTAGANASPVTAPWLGSVAFTPDVTMRPSILELVALVETVPREAWEFISSIAQSELAMIRTDELDRFNYLPMPYWAETAQQTVVDVLSTSRNAQDIDIDTDPSKIRNSVSVTYPAVTIGPRYEQFRYGVVTAVPPGITDFVFHPDMPIASCEMAFTLSNMAATDVANGRPEDVFEFVTVNTANDGSGTYLTSTDVTATIVAWDAGHVTLRLQNNTSATCWLANNNSSRWPVVGIPVQFVRSPSTAVVGRDDASISNRGERGLDISLPYVQDAVMAQAIANEIAARFAKPRKSIGAIPLFPDPRRQPGDLVTLTDAVNTGASGLWRVQSITHERNGDEYTQQALVNEALPVGHWDVDGWDNFVWGP